MNRVLAALHSVDVDAVGLSDYGKPGNYYARQIGRWTKQYRASETESVAEMEALIDWLPDNIPAGGETIALVHGDYRIDNMIFHPTEPKIIGILDWELSTLGDPLADLAYQLMAWQFPREGGMVGLEGVRARRAQDTVQTRRILRPIVKEPADQALTTGRSTWPFAFLESPAILQGIKKRALIGTASSAEADSRAVMVGPSRRTGCRLHQAKRVAPNCSARDGPPAS